MPPPSLVPALALVPPVTSGEGVSPEAPEAPETTGRQRSLLRFITCGSVDDGKSTLIGRLLYDAGQVYDDQLTALDSASDKFGTRGEQRDFALLVDGLSAEREQGITIDVAYRYFHTPRRSFIVADTPGHEQYTRNMATGASTADLAIILIDARKGVLAQTRRHALIVSMLGVRQVVLAVNKMDLVGHERARFDAIVGEFRALGFDFGRVTAIPIVATEGENLVSRGDSMPWYDGPTLIEHLETVEARSVASLAFRYPVQWVNRPDSGFRGYAGWVASGRIAVGDRVRVAVSGVSSRVARIVTADGDLEEAVRGQSVTLTLTDEIDVSRGDVLTSESDAARPVRRFAARLLWMESDPLTVGRDYILKLAASETVARIEAIDHAIDIATLSPVSADRLEMNGIGVVSLSLATPLLAVDYARDRTMGAFVLIDRISNATVALGLVGHDAIGGGHDGASGASGNASSPVAPPSAPSVASPLSLASLQALLGQPPGQALIGAAMLFIIALVVTRSLGAALLIALLDLAVRSIMRHVRERSDHGSGAVPGPEVVRSRSEGPSEGEGL